MDDDDDDEDAESSDLTELEDSDEDDMGGGGAGGTTTKPTSDFKAFSAAGTTPSRIGAAAATGFSPPSTSDRTKPMFSAPRGGGAAGGHSGMDSDEDEDEENGGRLVRGPGIGGLGGSAQEIGLEEDPISLEQVSARDERVVLPLSHLKAEKMRETLNQLPLSHSFLSPPNITRLCRANFCHCR